MMESEKKQVADEATFKTTTYSINDNEFIFFTIEHDLDCLTIETQSWSDCKCKKNIATEITKDDWLKGFGQARKDRRAAEREAAKAMRQAKS